MFDGGNMSGRSSNKSSRKWLGARCPLTGGWFKGWFRLTLLLLMLCMCTDVLWGPNEGDAGDSARPGPPIDCGRRLVRLIE